jgi:hypothetical protein
MLLPCCFENFPVHLDQTRHLWESLYESSTFLNKAAFTWFIILVPALIALGYGLDDWGSRVRFPAGAENFSLHHRVQNGSGSHKASFPRGTSGFFPVGKAAGA